MLDTGLRELDLSEKEIAVFKVLLEYGKLSPARISSLTGIKRTTVYDVCDELSQKGFVYEDPAKGPMYYLPASPSELKKITKKERQTLVNKELVLEEIIKDIKKLPQSKTYAVPKIRFIEGEENIKDFLYEHTAKWFESAKNYDNKVWGFQDHSFPENETYREWIEWAANCDLTIETQLLSNDAEIETEMDKKHLDNRTIEFFSSKTEFNASQWIVGDYSILIQARENPNYLVEMHDAVYCKNMRTLFKHLWEEIDSKTK